MKLAQPPLCTLKPDGNHVLAKKHRHGRARKRRPATIKLSAECTMDAKATVTGTLTETLSRAHGRHKTRTKVFRLKAIHVSLRAGVVDVVTFKLPGAALLGLERGKTESASFALTAVTASGTVRATAMIRSLRL